MAAGILSRKLINEYSLSAQDVWLFSDYKLKELTGIDEKYRYTMTRLNTIVDEVPI